MELTRRAMVTGLGAAALGAPRDRKPNFVFMLTDDQRWDTIAAWGNREVRTPNMDRIARRGVSFTCAQTQGGLSGAICMPSRAQILTGRSVFQVHQAIVDRQANPDPAVRTFPEHLRSQGYDTFHTGKWHLGPALFQRSFAAGAEIFFGGMSDQLKVAVQDYQADGKYPKERAHTGAKFSSEMFSDAAVGFLEKREKGRPFLLEVCYTSPHDPRMAPQRYADQYAPEKAALPKNFLPQHPFDNGDLKVRDELLAAFPRTEEEVRRHLAGYWAMIAEVDAQIGRVLDALEKSGEAENTYVIFAGDNGLAVGQHGLMGKQNLYDHSVRVPLMIAGPGIPRGKRNASLCHLMDIAPTVCALAGTRLDSATDGMSLAEAARSGRTLGRESTISAYRGFQRALRTRDWKLVLYNVNGTRTTQLFDLKNDPLEMRNLAGEAGQARRIKALTAELQERLKAAGDTGNWGG
jgi:arylsulfatase A-like enzyme